MEHESHRDFRLYLFDYPRLALDGREIKLNTRKNFALLAYLSISRKRQSREYLSTLLWPESPPDSARALLRNSLSVLRKIIGPSTFDSDRETVAFGENPDLRVDAREFTSLLGECNSHKHEITRGCRQCLPKAREAIELYTGPFLKGFSIGESEEFDTWVSENAEALGVAAQSGYRLVNSSLRADNRFEESIEVCRKWLSLDDFTEEAHRELIRSFADSGDKPGAIQQYKRCKELFDSELGLEPDDETTRLYHEILKRQSDDGTEKEEPLLPQREVSQPEDFTSGKRPLGENRMITVLFVDVSQTSVSDDEDHEKAAMLANNLLKRMVDVLDRFGGRVDKFLATGLLAVFGIPETHETDPERAVYAALALRKGALEAGTGFTAGINSGLAYFGGMKADFQREITVMGAAVDLAARLQESAAASEIIVGEATYRLTRRTFEFEKESYSIKGEEQRAPAYRVVREHLQPRKSRGIEGLTAKLIGRDEEYKKITGVFDAVRKGAGQIVCVIGEAGVGKTRLVSELRNYAAGVDGLRWLEGRCLEQAENMPYWPFVDLLKSFLGWSPEDGEVVRAEKTTEMLSAMRKRGELATDRIDEIGPLLGKLLSLNFSTEWDSALDQIGPEQIKEQTFIMIRDLVVALGKSGPVVVVLDDLHWADSLSLDLVSILMEILDIVPLLLVCMYRPEQKQKCWHIPAIAGRKCAEQLSEMSLKELAPVQARGLVESLLDIEELGDSAREFILSRSQGNPFFVEEVIRSLIDSELLYFEGDRWKAHENLVIEAVPEGLQNVILSRIDRFGEKLKNVLRTASVIGRLFNRRLLAHCLGHGDELERELEELEDRSMIYLERAIPEEEYSFKHVLTREAAYQSILLSERRRLHLEVARRMETMYSDVLENYYDELAYHYERSTDVEKTIEYLLKKGEKARKAYSNEEAAQAFQSALDTLKESTDLEHERQRVQRDHVI